MKTSGSIHQVVDNGYKPNKSSNTAFMLSGKTSVSPAPGTI